MWKALIQRELQEILRDGRFRLAALILAGLFAATGIFSLKYYAQLRTEHAAAAREARTQWENQGANNPHNSAHYGYYAFKPVYGLGALDPGIDKYLGVSVFLEAHKQNMDRFKPALDEHPLIRLEPFSPMFVLIYLMPLLILLLGYPSVSTEYESGRWRLMLSQGAPVSHILTGKALGIGAATLLLVVPMLLFMAVLVFGKFGAGPGEFLRFGLISLALLLYYGVFINLSVLTSALSKTSGQALVVLTALYIFTVWLMPRLAVNVAEQAFPTPTLSEYQASVDKDLEAGIDGHDPYDEFAQKLEAEVLAQYGVDSLHQLPFNWWGFLLQKGEEHEKVVYDKHMESLRDLYRRQLAVHQSLSILSPALLARNFSMSMARTDFEANHHFRAAAEAYRIELVGDLNKDLEVNSKFNDWEYKSPAEFFKGNKKFAYEPASLNESWRTSGMLLLLLAVWFVASAGLLFAIGKN